MDGFKLRRLTATEAHAHGERLRAIFRDAVRVAGPSRYSSAQVAVWAGSADLVDRWTPWLADAATWIATADADPGRAVGYAMRCPDDRLHHLFVDPDFHRHGLGGALLDAAEREARDEGVGSLTTEASLFSYSVFLLAGYELVGWQEVERGGLVFRRANMQKVLR